MTPTLMLALALLLCVWCFLAFYGVFCCSLNRGPLKSSLKLGDAIVFLFLVPAALLWFRDTPPLSDALALAPRGPGSRALLGLGGTLALLALAGQLRHSYRQLRPTRLDTVHSERHPARFQPRAEHWRPYADPERARQPESDEMPSPLPPALRPVQPVRPHPLSPRLTLHPLFRRIDQSFDLHVERHRLLWPALPESLEGLRILQIADCHLGVLQPPAYFEHLVEQAQALEPDLVAFTGDFTASDNLYKQSVEVFAPLQPPMGKWVVRGNHDFYEPDVLAYWFEHFGLRLLSNTAVGLERGDAQALPAGEGALRLVGIEHPYRRARHRFDELVGATPRPGATRPFRLVLSHEPDNFPALARAGADLVLSGHTHGGQWRLPLVGALVVPSVHGRRFDHGFHRLRHSLLYTSRGCGMHTIPLRFNCPPELALFELRTLTGAHEENDTLHARPEKSEVYPENY